MSEPSSSEVDPAGARTRSVRGTRHAVPTAPLRPEQGGDGEGAPSDGGLYGLEREEPNARRGGGWMVRLRRRGRMVARLFKDSIHGSPEAALDQAKAYREAVIAAIPPRTNREQAVRLRRNNTSGVSGVSRAEPASGAVWRVTLTAKDGLRRAEFAVAEHGEDGAERLALAQRRAWLDALAPAFTTADPHADAVARRLFGAELTRAVDVHPSESLSPAELEERLAAIDVRFDALRPLRLRVRVKSYAPGEFAVAVSDAGRPARRRLVQVRRRTVLLQQALRDVEAAASDLVTELYGAAVADWFRQEYLLGLLSLDGFDEAEGFNVCVLVPLSG